MLENQRLQYVLIHTRCVREKDKILEILLKIETSDINHVDSNNHSCWSTKFSKKNIFTIIVKVVQSKIQNLCLEGRWNPPHYWKLCKLRHVTLDLDPKVTETAGAILHINGKTTLFSSLPFWPLTVAVVSTEVNFIHPRRDVPSTTPPDHRCSLCLRQHTKSILRIRYTCTVK